MMQKFLFILFSIFFTFSSAQAGNTVANGGDIVAADFGKLAYNTIMRYEEWTFKKEYRPILRKLKEVVMTIQIRSEENLVLDSREVDAINIPSENLIIVNRSRWGHLRTNQQIQILIHEYLWVAGYDDSSYQLSAAIKAQGELPAPGFPIGI